MKYACQYAIVRFMPFVETGEFANVGIVLTCPETGFFDFKLLTRVRRITGFFDQMDVRIYRAARNGLQKELARVKEYAAQAVLNDPRSVRFLFAELTRPREVMLRYDAPRVVLANDPEDKLDALFAYYVERNFVTPEYVEKQLEKQLRGVLEHAKIKKMYSEARVKQGSFAATFPFAHRNANGVLDRAIKPLHLAHDDAAAAYEHGWAWVGRLKQLKHHRVLPDDVLIATNMREENDSEKIEVYREIKSSFESLGIKVATITDKEKIERFALEDLQDA
ncbi:hypothetical protein GCM10007205_20110 [Oxalicibacterium flavum]|uniref:DUF3037 domain-containing protein n=1 Tax=Oxalicibacterium flavum TaxID=179467 RepID=A0A8J2XYA3_9BURK|nr:DUF3037 domain-containing protein [Oxalicibacterium flavum]GGC10889.1 hypothetical protein GCM10007205_20110 [Oxalicibacterium flavum]